MRAVILVAAALLLAGCEHMYGGMDAGRSRISDEKLIENARQYATESRLSLAGMTPDVQRFDGSALVTFTYPDCLPVGSCLDGSVGFYLNPRSGRVLRLAGR